MFNNTRGLRGGLTDYGDKDFAYYLRKSFAKSMGFTNKSLEKPIVGICYTESGFNNCHRHFPEMLEATKRGILLSGGLPLVFPVISLGEVFLNPTSMVYRNLMAMAVEEMIRAQPMDSVVLMGGCDKTVPALLMGAISAGKPSILLTAGPMMTGRYRGERIGACTDCRRFWNNFRSGLLDKNEIDQIESQLAVTSGTCAVMGTASTMALIAETLGMSIPGSAAIPAVHADRLRVSEETGEVATQMAIDGRPTPQEVITKNAVNNALRVLLTVSGSSNAIIHLTAIAGRLGIDISFEQLNQLSDVTPVLVNLKPMGVGYMEDFYEAGGLDGVLHGLYSQLELNCKNIVGTTLKQRLANPLKKIFNEEIIRPIENPVYPKGGLIALKGSLAPEGAILKRAAATPKLLEHVGKAVVFSSLEDLAKRIDDPSLNVSSEDILVLQNAGPKSQSGMPEAGYLPIPKKLIKKGVKDMIRISDARMSGTAFGTIILHVTPEAEEGGPLALIREGDLICISEANKRVDLLVTKEELQKRKKVLSKKPHPPLRGYRKLYYDNVLPAPLGCDFDFLRKK